MKTQTQTQTQTTPAHSPLASDIRRFRCDSCLTAFNDYDGRGDIGRDETFAKAETAVNSHARLVAKLEDATARNNELQADALLLDKQTQQLVATHEATIARLTAALEQIAAHNLTEPFDGHIEVAEIKRKARAALSTAKK